ncbi:MAG: hypothetical protein ACYCUM_10305 [Solirubrobacteraceae bacterium]
MSSTSSSPAESLLRRASRLLAAAEREGTPLRLLGGAGIRMLLGERMHPRFERAIADIDIITTRRDGGAVERLLERQGFQPQRRFNALNGARRLLFCDEEGGGRVDVFVERFEMCHALPLVQRLLTRPQTLPAAELAMSKLQIVRLDVKDRDDLYALLATLAVGDADSEPARQPRAPVGQPREPAMQLDAPPCDLLNAARVATLAAEDWGLHHTFELNLARLEREAGGAALPAELAPLVRERIALLRRALAETPKSRAWRLRARIGERRRWYEQPEEVER